MLAPLARSLARETPPSAGPARDLEGRRRNRPRNRRFKRLGAGQEEEAGGQEGGAQDFALVQSHLDEGERRAIGPRGSRAARKWLSPRECFAPRLCNNQTGEKAKALSRLGDTQKAAGHRAIGPEVTKQR